jgi:chemotaxis protein MotB
MKRIGLMFAAVLAGCVTQGTYDQLKADDDALKAEHQKTLQTLAERDKNVADLKDTLAKEQAHAKDLGGQIAQIQANLAKANDDLTKANADLATTVKDKSSLKASIEDMKAALADAQKRKAAADARIAEFRSMLGRFKGLIDSGKLRVQMQDGRMVVELATDILFPSGSANLSKDGKAAIMEVAGLLASIPNRSFQIEGHTDNVPISTGQYHSNWELASARALTVLHTMVDSGMPANRISAASYGESKPAKANDTPENKAANRRIEIVVTPDLSGLPGFDELNKLSGASS